MSQERQFYYANPQDDPLSFPPRPRRKYRHDRTSGVAPPPIPPTKGSIEEYDMAVSTMMRATRALLMHLMPEDPLTKAWKAYLHCKPFKPGYSSEFSEDDEDHTFDPTTAEFVQLVTDHINQEEEKGQASKKMKN